MTQAVVIPCPHCGAVQHQLVESGQGSYKVCSNSKNGCGKSFYVQTDHNGLIERVDR
jgi:hypothetical protein